MSKVVSTLVYPIKRQLFCDCGTEMQAQETLLTSPPQYVYTCPNCGAKTVNKDRFPLIDYVQTVLIDELDLNVRAWSYLKQKIHIDTIEQLEEFMNDDKNVESLPTIVCEDIFEKLNRYKNSGESFG